MLHRGGHTQRLEWAFLDWHFAHVNAVPASPEIVHIDIDDGALSRVGSWPWPRDLVADMVRVLAELKAQEIVLDLVYSEPRPAEVRLPVLATSADAEAVADELQRATIENVVSPDEELAAAIREAGCVRLAMFHKPAPVRSPAEKRAIAFLAHHPEADAASVGVACGLDAAAARRLPLAELRREAVLDRVRNILAERPETDLRAVHGLIATAPYERETPLREDIRWAFGRARSLKTLRDRCPPTPPALRAGLAPLPMPTPPLFSFLEASRGGGFVVFAPDADGTLRHLPLLLDWEGRLVKQLAFAATCDRLGIRDEDLSVDANGFLRIAGRGDRAAMRVPLDGSAGMMLNWSRADAHPRRGYAFDHIPAAKVLEACDARREQRANEERKRARLARVMQIAKDEAAFAGYRGEVNAFLADRRRLRETERAGRGDTPEGVAMRERVREQQRRLDADHAATIAAMRETWKELQSADRSDPVVAAERERFAEAIAILDVECTELDRANASLAERAAAAMVELAPRIAGRTCFVGYTATALADMVDTPIAPEMPGVLAHSNLMNTFLQRAFVRWTGPGARAAVTFLLGVFVTVAAAARGPRESLAIVVAAMAGTLVLQAALLSWAGFWLGAVTAAPAAFVVWAMVVMFRFLVSERDRRRVARALAQYTSPAIARRIADTADRLDLSPVGREVSCFFSDLEGFTSITERHLDPAATRAVLNPYLESMSEVLNRHAALINKFMGDGIFAFFNPPIYPAPDHARRACEAAIDAQAALQDLIRRQEGAPLAPVFARLRMRIGLASGPVYVGDYGSESKLDYTCMGDTVNLASRLESANKAFGTRILVAGSTREAAGEGFVYRPLGSILVKGKTIAVPVHELLGRRGDVSPDDRENAEAFGAALGMFRDRRWDAAAASFDAILVRRPGDAAAGRYAALVRRFRASPPAADWNGAIELDEK